MHNTIQQLLDFLLTNTEPMNLTFKIMKEKQTNLVAT